MNTVVKCTNVNQGEGVQTVTLSNEANMEGFAPHGIKRGGSGYATIARDSRNEPQEKPTPKISIVIEIREHEKGYNHYKPGCFYTYSQMAIPQAINLNAKNEE